MSEMNTKNSREILGMTGLLDNFTAAARLLIEKSLGEWVDEHPDEAARLAADLIYGSLSIELICAVYPVPCIKLITSSAINQKNNSVLVEFALDKKGWH